ncbi:MAG: phosphoglycerate kinase [Wolbachia endosymbiont of Menacanthus eurysternus]|nr:MAG: phosphoglycerate kinase [Wolbachia endosymbiont of Menacanthus eurysternus]
MVNIRSIKNCDFDNKAVLVRVDFNVPIENGKIRDTTRILRVLPTIQYLVNANAKVIIASHFGRPKIKNSSLSLKNIVLILLELLNKEVKFINDCIGKKVLEVINKMDRGDIVLLENLRFYKEEEQNDLSFAKQLASIADIYVNDAFSCSHRAHASISRVTEFLPSYAGFCLQNELECLEKFVASFNGPVTAIVSGTKVITKVKMLVKLVKRVNYLILGGAIANNFLLFNRVNIGRSLFYKGIDDLICRVIETASRYNCKIIIPEDVLVAVNFDYGTCILRNIESVLSDDTILDIGPKTLSLISNIILNSKTLLWNGPIGAFEHPAFANGTIKVMKVVSDLTSKKKLTSVIGGGDILSAMSIAGLTNENFTYVSTGGGAFLTWVSGGEMPGVTVLRN